MTAWRSAIYRGHLLHVRHDRFARRQFRYPVYMACIDPAELPALHDALRLFSYNGRNLFALHDRAYSTPLDRSGDTRLVTNLEVAGYGFNPVSFHLRYDGSRLAGGVAEVNNTYGGRHCYQLDDTTRTDAPIDPSDRTGHAAFSQAKAFFVSPFLHGAARYAFDFACPLDGDELAITMRVHGGTPTAKGDAAPSFVARLTGRRRPLTDGTLARIALRYPLMTAQVVGLIHLQALRLRAAGVPYGRPGARHLPTNLDGTDVATHP